MKAKVNSIRLKYQGEHMKSNDNKVEVPIRVLHVFGALNPGGVETLVLNVYRCIDRSKIQFDFALTQGVKSLFDDEVLEMGGRPFYFDQNRSIDSNLSDILENYGPFQAVHSHIYFYSGIILRNAARHGVPVRIAHAHNTSFGQIYTWKRKAYEWLMRRLILHYSTVLLGCSTDACEYVFGSGCMDDPRCSILYNGFDVNAFRFCEEDRNKIRQEYNLTNSLVVGHVGRFEDQKNHMQLVEQFAALHKIQPDTMLLLVGRGSLIDTVRQKCETLGIKDFVVFAGAQKKPAPYLSAMDVFLFPSLYEGLGSALIEAQANGLYVITSADVVPADINVTGNAVFIPLTETPEVWAQEIQSHFGRKNPDIANSKVAEKYEIRVVMKKLASIYSSQQ